MEKFLKAKKKSFCIALTITILFICGIPMIPLGFIYHVLPIAIAGIIFTAGGFYGTPISWVLYGNLCSLGRLLYAIEKENIYTVSELSKYLQKPEKEIASQIRTLIQKTYLEGYIFDGQNLTLNENIKLKKKKTFSQCPFCGAPLPPQSSDDEFVKCPYCDSPIHLT